MLLLLLLKPRIAYLVALIQKKDRKTMEKQNKPTTFETLFDREIHRKTEVDK